MVASSDNILGRAFQGVIIPDLRHPVVVIQDPEARALGMGAAAIPDEMQEELKKQGLGFGDTVSIEAGISYGRGGSVKDFGWRGSGYYVTEIRRPDQTSEAAQP